MTDDRPENPELEPLTRTQVLIAMGVTAVLLLLASKAWVTFLDAYVLSVRWSLEAVLLGMGLGT